MIILQTIDYIFIVVIGILAILDIVLYTISYKKKTITDSGNTSEDATNMQEVLPTDSSTNSEDSSTNNSKDSPTSIGE